MGKLKTGIFVLIGFALMLSMVPNILLGEYPVILPLIILAGAFIALLPVFNGVLRRLLGRFYRVAARFGYAVVIAGVAVMIVLTAVMVNAAKETGIPEGTDVVVPGCAILGDQPRPMLKNRLDTAADYLKKHPSARCVVTGSYFGTYTQAEVMLKYLVEKKGIEKSRILVDDQSNTTYENLRNARELLGGSGKIAIATDVYHQYRGKKYARSLGFEPYALPSKTPLNHMVDAWLREYVGIAKSFVLGK